MDGIGPEELNVEELLVRADGGEMKEVVLALGATLEGDTTSFYLDRKLKERGVLVTMIARGISIGGDLDQVDEAHAGTQHRGSQAIRTERSPMRPGPP